MQKPKFWRPWKNLKRHDSNGKCIKIAFVDLVLNWENNKKKKFKYVSHFSWDPEFFNETRVGNKHILWIWCLEIWIYLKVAEKIYGWAWILTPALGSKVHVAISVTQSTWGGCCPESASNGTWRERG